MGGILLTLASAGVVCASGVAITTALRWFHTYKMDLRSNKGGSSSPDFPYTSRVNELRKQMKP